MFNLAPISHSRFSPSGSETWINCPGSLALIAQLQRKLDRLRLTPDELAKCSKALADGRVEQDLDTDELYEAAGYLQILYPPDTDYQRKGTACHKIAASMLQGAPMPDEIDGIEITEDMAESISRYVDYVKYSLQLAGPGAQLLVEQLVEFGDMLDSAGESGTLDAAIYTPGGDTIEVHDYKAGHLRVQVERNPQLMLYAVGLLQKLGPDAHHVNRVELYIHQGAIYETPHHWTLSVFELMMFAGKVREIIQLVKWLDENGVTLRDLHPKDTTCQWCAVKSRCPAYESMIDSMFEDLTGEPVDDRNRTHAIEDTTARVGLISDERLDALYDSLVALPKFIDAALASIRGRLDVGAKFNACKLVPGRKGNRKYDDEKAVLAIFKGTPIKIDEYAPRKLISAAKADKLLKNRPKVLAKVNEHVVRAAASNVLVSVDDPRKAVGAVEFEQLDPNDISDLL